jgi:hypothetical protein
MSDIEIKMEGTIIKPIDAFPRPTAPEATPPVTPKTEEKTPEQGEGVTPPTPPVETPVVPVVETPPAPEANPAPDPAQPAQPTAPEKKPEPDYKKKFSDSTRRNQIVESQFKELQKTLGDITKQEIPTDDEMVALVPDWEYLSDREKNGERKLIVLERRQNHMLNTFSSIASETENASKLEEFVSGEPRLAGREEAFYAFATDPRNKGAQMEVLVNAFLFEETPAVETPVVDAPPVETPPSLERGTPSGNMPPVQTGTPTMSDEELKVLRTTNPRKYNEMIRKGQIK